MAVQRQRHGVGGVGGGEGGIADVEWRRCSGEAVKVRCMRARLSRTVAEAQSGMQEQHSTLCRGLGRDKPVRDGRACVQGGACREGEREGWRKLS